MNILVHKVLKSELYTHRDILCSTFGSHGELLLV